MKTVAKIVGIIIIFVVMILAYKWGDDYEWHNGICRECNHNLKFDSTEYLKYDGIIYKYYCPNCHNRVNTHIYYEPIAE